MIVNPADDIFKQAHQGSVAAIIQVLNDKLADSGVRTRAIFANGVLQLLCEAATPEQLEETALIDRIRKTLEAISPRSIRRVNINSRIVREQQLLWLEEISRDPDDLLWTREIALKRPNFIRGWIEDWQDSAAAKNDYRKPLSAQEARDKRQFTKGILGGLGLAVTVLAAGWGIYSWQNSRVSATNATNPIKQAIGAVRPAETAPERKTDQTQSDNDSFAAAVRLAEQASQMSQTAQTPEQWKDVADLWGKASQFMADVSSEHKQHAIAQNRTEVYRKNQETALSKAK
jgi:hypothetical protein